MKWSAAFRASKKTLKSGALFWCILLSAVAVYWLIVSVNLWLDLSHQKSSPVTVTAMGNVSDTVIKEASKLSGVSVISERKTFSGTLVYGEYSLPVTIYGVSADYMRHISGLSDTDFDGAMPYVLLDHKAAYGFVNKDKEKLEITDTSDFIMQTVTLLGEPSVDFRIAGISVENEHTDVPKASKDQENTLTDVSTAGGSLYISIDWFEKLWPADTGADESGEIVIRLENGSFIENVSLGLSKLGMFVNESYTPEWAQMSEMGSDALYKGILAACCVILIGYYEFKFLQLKYKKAIEYMHWLSGGRRLTKIWLCRYAFAAASAVAAGFIYWGLRTIFTAGQPGM